MDVHFGSKTDRPSPAISSNGSLRLKSLDGLRGLAALVVVFSHLADLSPAFYVPHPPWSSLAFWTSFYAVLKYTPLRILIAGRACVMVFFVLSGFVLCLGQRSGGGYGAYLAKRVFRIWPPFAFSLLLAAGLYEMADPHWIDGISRHVNEASWSDPPTLGYLASNLLMLGTAEFPTLNNPTWSLVHELRISMVFPVIVLLLGYRFWPTLVLATVASIAAFALPAADPALYTIELTIGYTCFFVVGAALALAAPRITAAFDALPGMVTLALWGVALLLLMAPITDNLNSFAPGIGAALLIPLCITGRTAVGALESPVPQWLGRVSYSLYLIHVPILLAVVHLGFGRAPLPLLCLTALVIALGSAELCHRVVERPSMMLGRIAARRLRGGVAQRA